MAATSNLQPEKTVASLTSNFQDSITEVYLSQYDSIQTDIYEALATAQSSGPHPVPQRRQAYAGAPQGNIFAQSFSPQFTNETRLAIYWTVTYGVPEVGQTGTHQIDDPLLRPAVLNVEYIEKEYVIDSAENVEPLPHGDGKGGARAANTFKTIVNAAGKRPDAPLVDTERNAVLVVQKNFASLAEIVEENETYQRTANSDTPIGFSERRMRFLVTESLGLQVENNTEYWPGVRRIEVTKTTDLILDNVGYDYWDNAASDWKTAEDKDGTPMSEPINLKLDGDQGGDNTTTITYRHLTEVPYASLVT